MDEHSKIRTVNMTVSNKLLNEKSPYLLQHAYNPINWYSWGEEAFEKAKKENKPIFLSIGYSTCHWCHVMAHESFEDNDVAKLMNEVFVSIKVDREERPDIDQIYMNVCQMLTGSGGWPLTILLTPEKKPFFAGTYFPKTSRFGRIGLIELVLKVKELWNTQKKELLGTADEITFSLQNLSNEAPGEKLGVKTLKKAYNELSQHFDSKYGGFSKRPKFPTPHNLIFLLRFWNRTAKKESLEMVVKTLQEMRKGGIYDHIGFGFHRYSTDSEWLVPHFEKMLYDQALLAMAYTEGYQATENQEFAKTAKEILTYVMRDMTSSEGGFYSAEDADSEGIEGKFYVWSIEELEKTFAREEMEFLKKVYNVHKDGNYFEEATGHKTGKNIIHLRDSYANIAKELNLEIEQFKIKLDSIRERLFNLRNNRIHPYKDDKILTDWNGLMIAALAIASRAFSDSFYIEKAAKAVNFILSNLYQSNGRLMHRFRDAKAEIQAYLTDYAFLIWGLIEMYETTFDPFYLKTALDLNKVLLDHFWDNLIGGFFFTADDGEELLARQKEIYDGAIPSGNSIAMLNLIRLSYLTGDHELEEKAEILSRVFTEKIDSLPLGYTQFLIAIDFAVGPSYTLVIAGDSGANDTKEMLEKVKKKYIPNKVLIYRPTEIYPSKIDEYAKFIESYDKMDHKATAYVCINKTCKPPTNNIDHVLEYLNSKWI